MWFDHSSYSLISGHCFSRPAYKSPIMQLYHIFSMWDIMASVLTRSNNLSMVNRQMDWQYYDSANVAWAKCVKKHCELNWIVQFLRAWNQFMALTWLFASIISSGWFHVDYLDFRTPEPYNSTIWCCYHYVLLSFHYHFMDIFYQRTLL